MSEPLVIVAIFATVVPLLVGVLAYLGTRGSTRVEQERRLDAREDAAYARLEADRDRLELLLAACQAREASRSSSSSAIFAADLVVDVAVTESEQAKRREGGAP